MLSAADATTERSGHTPADAGDLHYGGSRGTVRGG